MSDSIIRTEQLSRWFRRGPQEVRAVDGVDMRVEEGEFLAIIGASGSGKSTLLNLLAGLDTPTSGRIEFRGTSLDSLSRRELASYRALRIGMMFQSFNLIHHRSALENVELALYFNDCPVRERRSRAAAMLERLGLADRTAHRPGDLSGGEQQRVALARALAKNPAILLADEPTGNLDRRNADQIMSLLSDLNARGLTIVMVTHDVETAGRNARRIVRMHYGRVVADSGASGEARR
ncbi:MAG: ABC transporter ATP-binding protein [Candidatus Krumholzibacteria bacterium]|nr:ABC transporter ATP-binding protein [Candidatus Krumholzibacteria bacterium]